MPHQTYLRCLILGTTAFAQIGCRTPKRETADLDELLSHVSYEKTPSRLLPEVPVSTQPMQNQPATMLASNEPSESPPVESKGIGERIVDGLLFTGVAIVYVAFKMFESHLDSDDDCDENEVFKWSD